jgi:hypothetical protein
MARERTAQSLREELSKYRNVKGFNRYPADLRDEAVDYARARRQQGNGPSLIAKELGIAVTTADAWSRPQQQMATIPTRARPGSSIVKDELSLIPVVVRPEQDHRVLARLEVEFSDGTRLQATGVGAEDLTRTIEMLRRPS